MAGLLELLMGQRNNNTPGINPNEPNPHTQAPQGVFGKADGFLNSDGGSLLLNLLAQQGYSTVPQSPLGALGRAGVATQQQKQARERSLLENQLLQARTGLTNAQADAADDGSALNPTGANVQSVFTDKDGNINIVRRNGVIEKTDFTEGVNARVVDGPANTKFVVDGRTGEKIGDLVSKKEAIDAAAEQKEAVAGASVRGETEEKRAQNLPQTLQAADQTIRGIDNVIDEVSRGLDLVGPKSTGTVGALLQHVPGTDAFALNKIRTTIKSNIGFDKLSEMRRVSPSGASGLGQLSTLELDGLQNGLTNLDQAQEPGDVKRAMMKVLTHYQNWRAIIEQHKFDEQRRVGETNVLPPGFSEAE